MKYLLSLYSFTFVRSLVYLLQKTEYIILDFINVLKNVKDFKRVEIRSKLTFTNKIKIIYFLLEFVRLFLFLFGLYKIFIGSLVTGLFILIWLPVLLVFNLMLVSIVFSFLQKPFEYYLIYQAKNKLKTIKAIKIAIAGSYGKTSMREILFAILSSGKKVATVKENFNTPIGIANFIMGLKGDEEILIFEFGEYYKGDVKYLCDFVQPDIGVITGINEAHLSKFKDIKNTISTIFELSDYLENKNVYVFIDNKYVAENIRLENIPFGIDGIKNIKAENIIADLSGTEFIADGIKHKTSLIGKHHISAILLGIYFAKTFNINQEDIEGGVRNIKPFKNRLELKSLGNNILLLDDTYNGNIDGFMVTLDFLRNIKDRRIVYITPGLVETGTKNEELHLLIGKKITEAGIQNVVLIDNSATQFIRQGLRESNYKGDLIHFKNMLDVLGKLSTFTLENDLVVIQNDWSDQYY